MRILHSLALCLALITAGARAADVDPLLSRLPAKTTADEAAVAADLAKLGPAGIKAVCAKIVPLAPGGADDTPARAAITALQRRASDPANAADRRVLAAALCDALTANADPEVRSFYIERLKWIGDDDSVAPVAAYLADKALAQHAAGALERIGTNRAVAALEQALDGATEAGPQRNAIVKSLGSLRAPGKAEQIRQAAASADPTLRLTALWALANIGDAGAADLLDKAEQSASKPYERSRLTSARLLLIERRFADHAKDSAVGARDLVKKYADAKEVDVAIAALHLLAANLKDEALPDLMAATDSARADLRNGALDAAALIKGPGATAKWAAKAAESKQPLTKADVVAFLGRRGDAGALDAVVAATKDTDANVRLEAARAAVRLSPERAVEPLIAMLKSTDKSVMADAPKIVEMLARLPGPAAISALATAASADLPAPAKAAVVETLGTRAGADPAARQAVRAATKSADAPVRAAAWRAIERTATAADAADLVPLALAAEESDQATAFRAVGAASAQAPAGQRADALLAALPKATAPAARAALLKALAKTGEPKALAAVTADLDSADARDTAIRALSEWADESAAAPLLDVAAGGHGAPANQQILALRGAIAVTRASAAASDKKLAIYAKALATAKRPDEKKLVLAALSSEHSAAALDLAAPLLDDAALQAEASLAVVKIAAPIEKGQKGLTGPKVVAALEKAIPNCPDATAKAAATKHLNAIKKAK